MKSGSILTYALIFNFYLAFAQANNDPGYSFRDCINCPEMVVIPTGSFLMGAPEEEPGRFNEELPQRGVNIPQFAAGKYTVTRGQWAAFVSATDRKTSEGCDWSGLPTNEEGKASWSYLGFFQDNMHPVVCITWDDAQDYVQWISKLTGGSYRLLTESEWEYAARAGTTTAYPWGSKASHEYANYGTDICCSGYASGRDEWDYGTAPVGSFPPNDFGLFDMHGNVMQWVEDCFATSYLGLPTDGTANKLKVQLKIKGELEIMNGTSSCDYRMCRGGDFGNPPEMIRSASRNWAPPHGKLKNYRSAGLGFRIAKSL